MRSTAKTQRIASRMKNKLVLMLPVTQLGKMMIWTEEEEDRSCKMTILCLVTLARAGREAILLRQLDQVLDKSTQTCSDQSLRTSMKISTLMMMTSVLKKKKQKRALHRKAPQIIMVPMQLILSGARQVMKISMRVISWTTWKIWRFTTLTTSLVLPTMPLLDWPQKQPKS